MCESILGEKALSQIICCGLGHLCGIGWQWDEGLIDRHCDWKCNPSLPLCPSPPTVWIISPERTQHTAARLTDHLRCPDGSDMLALMTGNNHGVEKW